MRKRGISKGGCLFAIGMIAVAIYAGIYRAYTGHFPNDLSYWVLGAVVVSIAWDIYFDLHEAIDMRAAEIKQEIERAKDEILEEIRRD